LCRPSALATVATGGAMGGANAETGGATVPVCPACTCATAAYGGAVGEAERPSPSTYRGPTRARSVNGLSEVVQVQYALLALCSPAG